MALLVRENKRKPKDPSFAPGPEQSFKKLYGSKELRIFVTNETTFYHLKWLSVTRQALTTTVTASLWQSFRRRFPNLKSKLKKKLFC